MGLSCSQKSYGAGDFFDTDYLGPPTPFRLKSGTDFSLEEEADRLLAKSREGVTALRDKRDYLTKDQLALRAAKEVTNTNGVPDESLMCGIFGRAYNPLSGKRPGSRTHYDD